MLRRQLAARRIAAAFQRFLPYSTSQRQHRDKLQCFAAGFSKQTGSTAWSRRSDALLQQASSLEAEEVPSSYLTFFATCHPGLEQVVAKELADSRIGACGISPGRAGVEFRAPSLDVGYRANLWLRAAIRVLVLLSEGDLDAESRGGDTLYDFVRQSADWSELLPPKSTFGVDAIVADCSDLKTNKLAATRAKDAVCDELRDRRGTKPPPPGQDGPTLPLYLTAHRDHVRLYRDMSGVSLHRSHQKLVLEHSITPSIVLYKPGGAAPSSTVQYKMYGSVWVQFKVYRRGYRQAMHRASLNESAAAGLLLIAGWQEASQQPGMVLADPMCGSGTFLIEAALIAANVPVGLLRERWPFQGWHDFDPRAWREVCREGESAARPWEGRILGNDVHPGAISLAKRDAQAAGVEKLVRFHTGDCREWQPSSKPQMVITNPPWGSRLLAAASMRPSREDREDEPTGGSRRSPRADEGDEGPSPELKEAWYSLGTFLKAQCPGSTAYVLSGSTAGVTRELRMRTSRKFPITMGGVDARLLKYDVNYPPGSDASVAAADSTA